MCFRKNVIRSCLRLIFIAYSLSISLSAHDLTVIPESPTAFIQKLYQQGKQVVVQTYSQPYQKGSRPDRVFPLALSPALRLVETRLLSAAIEFGGQEYQELVLSLQQSSADSWQVPIHDIDGPTFAVIADWLACFYKGKITDENLRKALRAADYLGVPDESIRLALESRPLVQVCALLAHDERVGEEYRIKPLASLKSTLENVLLTKIPFKQVHRLGAVKNKDSSVGHIDDIMSVAILPDGKTLVTGSIDCTAIIWEQDDGGQWRFAQRLGAVYNRDPAVGHVGNILSIAVLADGKTLVTGSIDRTAIIWQQNSRGQWRFAQRLGAVYNRDPAVGHVGSVISIAVLLDGKTVVTGSVDHTAVVWHKDEHGWHLRERLGVVNNKDQYTGHIRSICSVALSEDGKTLVTGSDDRTAVVWHKDEHGWHLHERLGVVNNEDQYTGHIDSICSVALSEDGKTVVTGSYDYTALVWHKDGLGWHLYQRLSDAWNEDPDKGHTNCISSVALSVDGKTLVTGSWDHTAIVWHNDESGWHLSQRLGIVNNNDPDIGHRDSIQSVALSKNGKMLITGSDDHTAVVWQRENVESFCQRGLSQGTNHKS